MGSPLCGAKNLKMGLWALILAFRLLAVLNAAARLIFDLRRSDHVSDALICLHCLRVHGRIRSKIAVLGPNFRKIV